LTGRKELIILRRRERKQGPLTSLQACNSVPTKTGQEEVQKLKHGNVINFDTREREGEKGRRLDGRCMQQKRSDFVFS
jgi:hypothetical protein